MSDRGHMCTCHMILILMYVIYVMPFFHFAEWVELFNGVQIPSKV